MRRQRGATAGIILVILALVAVGFIAASVLSRLRESGGSMAETERNLKRAADAIEAFAANTGRLPCPAGASDTAATEGEERRTAGATTCLEPTGVVPWKTIGLRRDDALDAWGRRVSYRVYTGAGSLTQDGGVSMIYCDSWETGLNQSADANGLCRSPPPAAETLRTTSEAGFLSGKSLTLTDMGNTPANVAFVLVSHGASGLGATSTSGTTVEPGPTSPEERRNLLAVGPFTIMAFSGTSVFPRDAAHFDDMLVYRTLPDMVKRINLAARDWPDPTPPGSTAFTTAAVTAAAAALGQTVVGTDTNTPFLVFGDVTAIGLRGGAAQDISLETVNGNAGIGVFSPGNPKLTYSESEWMIFLFGSTSRQFGVTFNDFGHYTQGGIQYAELALILFYNDGTFVKGVAAAGCRADGQLASYTVDVGANFNRAYIFPYEARSAGTEVSDTGLYISEVRSCPATAPNCRTGLSSPVNTCPDPSPI